MGSGWCKYIYFFLKFLLESLKESIKGSVSGKGCLTFLKEEVLIF